MICSNCAQKLKTKEPNNGTTWHIAKCDYCGESSYVTEPRDFGISTTSSVEVGDEGVELIKNLLFK